MSTDHHDNEIATQAVLNLKSRAGLSWLDVSVLEAPP